MFEQTPDIVLGPPGTGKTTHLLSILREELTKGTPPDRIGFVTFTRKAAEEAQDRVSKEFGLNRSDLPHFRTLHSLCMKYSGMSGGNVLQGKKLDEFADWIGVRIKGRLSTDGVWSGYEQGDRLMFMDGVARIRQMPLRKLYEEDHDDLDWALVERFSRGLRDYKQHNHLFDFTDMLEEFVRRGNKPQLDVLLVDEAQDLSLLQWQAVYTLAKNVRRVVVAGDDDQNIFQWAGSDADTLIDMPGNVRVLNQSYRVPRNVQKVAAEVINRVRRRREKNWNSRDEDGVVKYLTDVSQADFSGDSVMILSRNRHQLDGVEHELRAAGLLYEKEGMASVSRSLLDRIVVWERLRRGEPQLVADVVGVYDLMSLGTRVTRGFKKLPAFDPHGLVTLQELRKRGGLLTEDIWHIALDKISPEDRSYLVRCRKNNERLTVGPRIKLSTIHGSKGGEANRVILMTDMAPRTWRESHTNPDAEARVFYVGLTRAREELHIVAPQTPRNYPL